MNIGFLFLKCSPSPPGRGLGRGFVREIPNDDPGGSVKLGCWRKVIRTLSQSTRDLRAPYIAQSLPLVPSQREGNYNDTKMYFSKPIGVRAVTVFLALAIQLAFASSISAQGRSPRKAQTSHSSNVLSPEARE